MKENLKHVCRQARFKKQRSTCKVQYSILTQGIWNLQFCTWILFLLISAPLHAQTEIPLGTWRAHISYNSIHDVAVSNEKIFAASANGIIILDRNEYAMTTLTKLNGLSGTGISSINFDTPSGQLLIGFDDGKLNVVKENRITSYNPTQNSVVTGSKKINNIAFQNALAYLSTDYGVVVFDLNRAEIKETWRDIGINGARFKIFQSTFLGDSVFLATENGILAGDLRTNLLDFNKWKRFDTDDFNNVIQTITSFDNKVYTAVNQLGIYYYENGKWIKENFLEGVSVPALNSSASHLLITEGNRIWLVDNAKTVTQVVDNKIDSPQIAKEDANGNLWVGDKNMGLISNATGNFVNYLPNGPSASAVFRLRYNDNRIYLLPQGVSSTFEALRVTGELNVFQNGMWSNVVQPIKDLTDIAFTTSGKTYLSSFGYGVQETNEQSTVKLFDESNSSLINLNPPERNVNVSALATSSEGLWVANYGASQPLHLYANQSWQSFSFTTGASHYPTDMVVDFFGRVWMVLNPSQGGGIQVFGLKQNKQVYITNQSGAGNLPNKSVRSIVVDRDGNIWVGTDTGVAYFFDANSDAVRPVFESRLLLSDEKVTAIAVDGGNRKWIGTERGVWVFNPTGEELIHNFTAENSPLLSNRILDIEINSSTGEVFFATDRGLVSFRGDATEGFTRFHEIKIFPNPITNSFTGSVGITGLATDAIVKITDARGKLLFQTRANGGTASWNLRDYTGKRVPTGIFLVFVAKQDASENMVGKIAVIE